MKKALCRPCMEDLIRKGRTVREIAGRREKITCAVCGRRRYGLTYEVSTGRKPRKKLTEVQIDALAAEYKAGGVTQSELAEKYGVCTMTVSNYLKARMSQKEKAKRIAENVEEFYKGRS